MSGMACARWLLCGCRQGASQLLPSHSPPAWRPGGPRGTPAGSAWRLRTVTMDAEGDNTVGRRKGVCGWQRVAESGGVAGSRITTSMSVDGQERAPRQWAWTSTSVHLDSGRGRPPAYTSTVDQDNNAVVPLTVKGGSAPVLQRVGARKRFTGGRRDGEQVPCPYTGGQQGLVRVPERGVHDQRARVRPHRSRKRLGAVFHVHVPQVGLGRRGGGAAGVSQRQLGHGRRGDGGDGPRGSQRWVGPIHGQVAEVPVVPRDMRGGGGGILHYASRSKQCRRPAPPVCGG